MLGPDDADEPPASEATDAEAPARRGTPREPAYEEVTLADLLDVLIRCRALLATVFLVVVAATVTATAIQEPTYEASATLVPTNEQDAVREVLESRSYAEDSARNLGLVDELGGGDPKAAGQALGSQVDVSKWTREIGGQDRTILTVTASASTAAGARDRANAWLDTLPEWRGYLENVTWDRKWASYYEDAGKNETRAKEQLSGLVENVNYTRELDRASAPGAPVSPDWRHNLALGGTLATMLSLLVPFLVEGVSNALEERRRRTGDG